jgi:tRNA U34 5-carboxymethylaminomethyl modifying GTPase MnmE/TrmE
MNIAQTPSNNGPACEIYRADPQILRLLENNYPEALADPDQFDRFIRAREWHEHHRQFIREVDDAAIKEESQRVTRQLNPSAAYEILLLGKSGSGKSTLMNALVGRSNLVPTKQGFACTGVVTEVLQDMSEDAEKAVVIYRDQAGVKQLIEEGLTRFNLTAAKADLLRGDIDDQFVQRLRDIELEPNATNADRDREAMLEALIDVAEQAINFPPNGQEQTYLLSETNQVDELNQLLSQHSNVNLEESSRRVGIIEKVRFHVALPAETEVEGAEQVMGLPKSVIFCDLPGIGGGPFHELILSEKLETADAVLFVINPRRISQEERALIPLIRRSLRNDHLVFLVLNAKDESVDSDSLDAVETLASELYGDMPTRFYKTSALGAILARESLAGESIQLPERYAVLAKAIAPEATGADGTIDHQNVLESSGIPKLVVALNKAIKNRLSSRLSEAETSIRWMREQLRENYQKQLSDLNATTQGQRYVDDFENIVENAVLKQKNLVKTIVRDFRRNRLADDMGGEMMEEKLPDVMEKMRANLRDQLLNSDDWVEDYDSIHARSTYRFLEKQFFSRIEEGIWGEISAQLPPIANWIWDEHRAKFSEAKIVEQIIEHCAPSAAKSVNVDFLDGVWREMEGELKQYAEQVGLGFVKQYSISDSEETDAPAAGGDHKKTGARQIGSAWTPSTASGEAEDSESLITMIRHLPEKPDRVTDDELESISAAVIKNYEPLIVDSVTALISVYQTQLLTAERVMSTLIDKVFRSLESSELSDLVKTPDAELRNQIHQLESKLNALEALYELPEPSN